jgi:hypothetical protein
MVNNAVRLRWFAHLDLSLSCHRSAVSSLHRSGHGSGLDASSALYRSVDGGSRWSQIGHGLGSRYIEAFAAAPSDPRVIYVLDQRTLYVSTNRGDTFTNAGVMTRGLFDNIAVDPRDPATVFIGTSAASDAFVAKIAAGGGALEYSTYLGGSQSDAASGVAVDDFGRAIVFGSTSSPNFPAVGAVQQPGAQTQPFISVLDGAGSVLLFSSVLGTTASDRIASVLPSGPRILFSGRTPNLLSLFPAGGKTGGGGFIGMLDFSYGAPPAERVP